MKRTTLYACWLAVILALIVLHAIHPRADFPASSPWKDFAKYTDEGWYSKAAVDHYSLGSWYVPGGFNAAVALPVLPALESAVFSITGPDHISRLAPARLLLFAVFVLNLVLAWLTVRTQAPRWTAFLAVTLLASSAFIYVFSRLVILEPLVIFFLFASWIIALRLPLSANARAAACAVCGLLLCLMILAKTTAAVLLPSTFFLLWIGAGPALAARLKAIDLAAAGAALPWSAYYLLWVRPRYLADYRYLFTANAWKPSATLAGRVAVFRTAFSGTFAIGKPLVLLALLLSLLVFWKTPRRNPLAVASLLAIGGYLFFMGWHNIIQPRYYLVVAYPLMILIALAAERLVTLLCTEKRKPLAMLITFVAVPAAFLLALTTVANLRQIILWTEHPEYTWLNAANGVTGYIDQHSNGNRLLLSSSADEIALTTGQPGIGDSFGTWPLSVRIQRYKPAWYATWNTLDPKILADLQAHYRLEQVASFHAYTDPGHDMLILYKLHPLKMQK